MTLLRGQGFAVTTSKTLPLTLIGVFFNFAMPGGVGGDVIKAFYLIQEFPGLRVRAAMTVIMDRIIGLFVMVGVAVVVMLFKWQWFLASAELAPLFYAVSTVFVGFVVIFVVLFSRRLHKKAIVQQILAKVPGGSFLEKLYDAFRSYRDSRVLLKVALLSFLSQVATILLFISVGHFMGMASVPWSAYFFVVPMGLITMSLPIAPAGIGVGQMAMFYLFNWYLAYNTQLGPNAITALQVSQFMWGLVGAYFYLRRRKLVPSDQEATL
jgi:uncharacterized protein (TIRG00374 family)